MNAFCWLISPAPSVVWRCWASHWTGRTLMILRCSLMTCSGSATPLLYVRSVWPFSCCLVMPPWRHACSASPITLPMLHCCAHAHPASQFAHRGASARSQRFWVKKPNTLYKQTNKQIHIQFFSKVLTTCKYNKIYQQKWKAEGNNCNLNICTTATTLLKEVF